jgi:hypothetical protein
MDHDSSTPEARLVVPAHGAIRLVMNTLLDERRLRVTLEPADPGGTKLTFVDAVAPYYGTRLLPAVLPGRPTRHRAPGDRSDRRRTSACAPAKPRL